MDATTTIVETNSESFFSQLTSAVGRLIDTVTNTVSSWAGWFWNDLPEVIGDFFRPYLGGEWFIIKQIGFAFTTGFLSGSVELMLAEGLGWIVYGLTGSFIVASIVATLSVLPLFFFGFMWTMKVIRSATREPVLPYVPVVDVKKMMADIFPRA